MHSCTPPMSYEQMTVLCDTIAEHCQAEALKLAGLEREIRKAAAANDFALRQVETLRNQVEAGQMSAQAAVSVLTSQRNFNTSEFVGSIRRRSIA